MTPLSNVLTAAGFREHISEQRFTVLRQPIIDLKDGHIHHYEWLVRFEGQGTEGVIRPAEISGVIRDLDLSMLAQAILVLNADPVGPGIAINLSGASVDRENFKSSVLACLTALEASPSRLIMELTESWDMDNIELAENLLTELKSRGHPVCLDDVGAGAASIRYLRALPANWLKIDGAFIVDAYNKPRDRAILEALLTLREPLDVRFIAEGIETVQLLDFVRRLGIDAVQGYIMGKPEVETRIK